MVASVVCTNRYGINEENSGTIASVLPSLRRWLLACLLNSREIVYGAIKDAMEVHQ